MLAKICFIVTAPNLEEILASIDNRKEFTNNDLQNTALPNQDLTAFVDVNFANSKIIVD